MKAMLLATVFAGALLTSPAVLHADDHGTRTYDDARHGDKHEWNDHENEAWNRYRKEHHIKQSEFARAKRRQQEEYWSWRHDHPDHH